MRIHDLTEDRIGRVQHTSPHATLYHLTDSYGIGLVAEHDALMAFRQPEISTTYDPAKNSIYGYHHYHYKLILDGEALARTYGVFSYDFHAIENGESVSLDEREIRVATPAIRPLSQYLQGVVLLLNPRTKHGVYNLVHRNLPTDGFGGSKRGTITAIEALMVVVRDWGTPLFVVRDGDTVPVPADDWRLLQDIHAVYQRIPEGKRLDVVARLLDRWDIKDHGANGTYSLDQPGIDRRRLLPGILRDLNGYFRDRPYDAVDPDAVRSLYRDWLRQLGYGNNAQAVLLHAAEAANLFHPVVTPLDHTAVLRSLIDGDVEEAMEHMRYSTPTPSQIARFERPSRFGQPRHVGAGMALET